MKKKRLALEEQVNRGQDESVVLPPQMSEEMYAIMPNFPKWREVFFRLDCICVGFSVLFSLALFGYFYYANIIEEMEITFLVLHILVPSVLNVLILVGTAILMKHLPEYDMRKNFIPIFALLLIDFVTCMVHRVFMVTLGIFCVPICMTTVFSNKKMCRLITNISMAGVFASTVKQFLFTADKTEQVWVIAQGLIVLCILHLMGIAAQTALSMTEGQKHTLMNYAKSVKEEQHRSEAANIAKSAFLANMSHEIRTPINAILGMNEMILRENENEQIAEYAKSIHSAGSSLLYLVNDVLDISKIESGKLELVETTYETSSFIHDCCNMIAEKAGKKGLELKIECNPGLPSQLRGDEVRLRQVVTNLLSNAAKYTKKGSITLSADSRREQEIFFLIITVKDTGIGIQEENLKNLFSQFVRFDMKNNRNIEGTGLGLAISKQLVDLMHGEIQVQSVYGEGSTFTVTVPQQVIDTAPMGDFHSRYREASKENAKYQQSFEAPDARILVVDDVEVNLRVIGNLLKRTKIHVDTALSGRKCLEMTEKNAYDIIFMDHMMPEMDGVETYSKMKESESPYNKNTPVIMLTANAITGVREQYLKEGFADYLSKPVLGDKLEKMILKYLPRDKIQAVMPALREEPSGKAGSQTDGGGVPEAGQAQGSSDREGSAGVLESLDSIVVLQNLFQAYPGVDIALGLSYCGQDMDTYVSALQAFGESAKIEELNGLYEQRDAANYQIVVHGVKSASLNIGFSGLSKRAHALEDAARDGSWNYIAANHAAFIEEYKTVVSAVSKAAAGDI